MALLDIRSDVRLPSVFTLLLSQSLKYHLWMAATLISPSIRMPVLPKFTAGLYCDLMYKTALCLKFLHVLKYLPESPSGGVGNNLLRWEIMKDICLHSDVPMFAEVRCHQFDFPRCPGPTPLFGCPHRCLLMQFIFVEWPPPIYVPGNCPGPPSPSPLPPGVHSTVSMCLCVWVMILYRHDVLNRFPWAD